MITYYMATKDHVTMHTLYKNIIYPLHRYISGRAQQASQNLALRIILATQTPKTIHQHVSYAPRNPIIFFS